MVAHVKATQRKSLVFMPLPRDTIPAAPGTHAHRNVEPTDTRTDTGTGAGNQNKGPGHRRLREDCHAARTGPLLARDFGHDVPTHRPR
jgi:hypothetical protein